jgi:hypothetical protein
MNYFSDFSVDQGKLLSLMPVIPTLLSVVGSVNIARLVKNSKSFGASSARNILFGISVCEVVSSVAFSLQSLFINRQGSHFLAAMTNGSVLGAIMHFSISSFLYNCLVSFVYLGKSAQREKAEINHKANRDFVVKLVEPSTPALGLVYLLMTASIGAGMRIYSGLELTSEDTVSQMTLYPGHTLGFLVAAVMVNSLVIWSFCRAVGSTTNGVATAAVLLTYIWTAILRVFESNDIRSSNGSASLLPLILLQALILPALGMFNLAGWISPRYIRCRKLYPFESRAWAFLHVVFGEQLVRPTQGWQPEKSFSLSQIEKSPSKTDFPGGELFSSAVDDGANFSFSSRKRCRF